MTLRPHWPFRRVALLALALGVLLVSGLAGQNRTAPSTLRTVMVDGREAIEGEVLVRFKSSPDGFEEARAASDVETAQTETIARNGVRRWRARRLGTRALMARLRANPDVEFVEPNYVIHVDAVPNDPQFGNLWGLFNSGQTISGTAGIAGVDIDAPLAWDISTGSRSRVVGIIDTGIDYTHPDLVANIWSAPTAFSVTVGGVVINCAAGTHGFNAITNTCNPMDDHSHGTHVAGTIGAVGNNGVGVVGVNWLASMMGLKFLGSGGSGSTSDAVKAIDFAIQTRAYFGGAGGSADVRVLSNSWGGGGFSQSLLDAINRANTANMLFVAAAGNDSLNNDVYPNYPSNYTAPNVLAVAATTNREGRSSFSNYGASTVDLGAPGTSILSTTPNNTYSYFNGTSMATPHVSGAAALVLAACSQTTAELKNTLMAGVDLVPSLNGITVTGGRLNVNRSLRSCMGQVSLNSVTPSSGSGTSQTFTLSYGDTLGAMDINVAGAWFGTSLSSSANSCVTYYNPNTNRAYLLNDQGTTWNSALLGSGTLSNSSCSVALASTTASTSGNTLTVNLAMSFAPATMGTKQIYMYAAGITAPAAVGWTSKGTWTVTDGRITPTVTWAAPSAITYPTLLSGTQLNATASVPGTFTYNPPAGTRLNAGSQVLTATFTPTDTATYAPVTRSMSLGVNRATPIITWPSPGSMTIGTPLGASQLNASANVAGTFSYTPAAGTILAAGIGQVLQTLFIPTDTVNYIFVPAQTTINVIGPSILAAASVTATANAGSAQVFTAVFTDSNGGGDLNFAGVWFGSAAANSCMTYYNPLTSRIYLLNDAASAWTSAALGSGSLQNAQCAISLSGTTANISGTTLTLVLDMTFSPGFAGARTISMMAMNPAGQGVGWVAKSTYIVTDGRVAPAVTWAAPSAITYPTLLSATQLNATANVPGTFTYSPAIGTRLNAGTQTLAVTFTPTDTATYFPVTRTVTLSVGRATPIISWPAPGSITVGTPLGAGQLNASANVPGSFSYTPAAGTVLGTGSGQVLQTLFMPADTVNYSFLPAQTTISVIGPSVLSTVSVTPSAGAGSTQVFTAQFSDSNGASNLNFAGVWFNNSSAAASSCMTYYNPATSRLYLLNDAATAWVSSTLGSGTLQNTACTISLSGTTASISGTTLTLALDVTFSPGYAGTKTISMMATNPQGQSTSWMSKGSYLVSDGRVAPTVTWGTPSAITYGQALGGSELNASASVAGSFTYSPAAGSILNGGANTLTAYFTPTDGTTYLPVSKTVVLVVNKATPSSSWATPANLVIGIPLGGTQLNATASVPGTWMYTPSAGTLLSIGAAQTLSATFMPANPQNYNGVTRTVAITITPVPSVTVDSVVPNAGSGTTQTFALQFTDTIGGGDLNVAAVWFRGAAGTTANACVAYYNPSNNTVNLLNDTGSAWTPAALGSGTLQNSACSISLASTTAAISGSTLTVNLAVTFKPAFTGAKTVLMYGANPSGMSQGWLPLGSWMVP